MDLALTFDDVCLVPAYNNVDSRDEPILDTWFSKIRKIKFPLIPSNMDTVISPELAWKIHEKDGVWIMHRFCKRILTDIMKEFPKPYGISLGVRPDDKWQHMLDPVMDDVNVICVDVAHAHGIAACHRVTQLKGMFGDSVDIVAGNVCTPSGYVDLVNAGADAVKVGVGCGAACTTRLVTGFGVPQFSAIYEVAREAQKRKVPIIADGGIRNSRDVVLALAAGASTVMMGKLFAACKESAAEKRDRTEEICLKDPKWGGPDWSVTTREAKYRGQASFDFQQEFYGEVRHAPEGEAMWIPVTGTFDEVVEPLVKAIKAGMTYGGARSISELQRKAEFRRVTSTYQAESGVRK